MKIGLMICGGALMLALAGCGADADPNNGATNNGATNNGATNNGATNNGATNNGTTEEDPCAVGRFTETEVFSARNDLVFDFEHPAGWELIGDIETEDSISFSLRNPGEDKIQIQVLAEKMPLADKDARTTLWNNLGGTTESIEYNGETVDIYKQNSAIVARAALPHEGGYYAVDVEFAQSGCEDERTALRALFLDTLTPNTDVEL